MVIFGLIALVIFLLNTILKEHFRGRIIGQSVDLRLRRQEVDFNRVANLQTSRLQGIKHTMLVEILVILLCLKMLFGVDLGELLKRVELVVVVRTEIHSVTAEAIHIPGRVLPVIF